MVQLRGTNSGTDRMPQANGLRLLTLVTVALMTLGGVDANAQDDVAPTNDLPNPYQSIAPWGNLPSGRTWGALNAVAIDNDGESVWVVNQIGRASCRERV